MSGLNQSEIIEMARQAGVRDDEHIFEFSQYKYLERFAKLVAQHEREACAKVCEQQYEYYGHDHVFAKAIRERK